MQRLCISEQSLVVGHSVLPAGMFLEPYVGRVQMEGMSEVHMGGSGSLGWYAGFLSLCRQEKQATGTRLPWVGRVQPTDRDPFCCPGDIWGLIVFYLGVVTDPCSLTLH